MDFVEFMPERDVDSIGAFTFARLITTALGVIARQASRAGSWSPGPTGSAGHHRPHRKKIARG